MSPQRRDVLTYGGVALATALAGCSNDGDADADDPTDTPAGNGTDSPTPSGNMPSLADFETTALGEELSAEDVSVTLDEPSVRSSMLYETGEGDRSEYGLKASSGTYYLLATVEAGEGGPTPESFMLVTESNGNYLSADPVSGNPLRERGERYDPENGATSGWVAFPAVGGVDYSNAAVVVDGTESGWELDSETLSALSNPVPSFSLDGVDAPASVAPGSEFDLTVRFSNDGETAGTARGVVWWSAPNRPMRPFAVDVAAGETGEHTERFTASSSGGESTYVVQTVAGNAEVTVTVGDGGNSSNGSENGS
ncbi:hypothetical protein [Halomarina rubra]|uniref:Uncharacterized protein n=1 Tax=Halomarina rubra TaxID=2071873 RepID=A0ABD6AZ15_9EURY|nr:hypothetical protein [Halomarina rubra]